MKETGILYTSPMVRSLLDDTKTKTRRKVRGEPLEWLEVHNFAPDFVANAENRLCPYGFAGDLLWVRETFFAWGRWETRFSAKKRRDEWHFIDMTLECWKSYTYPATDTQPLPMRGRRDAGVTPGWWRRPAIFMPRAASRITLEITGVRVERLQDISEADAKAEGCAPAWLDAFDHTTVHAHAQPTYKRGYARLWGDINGNASWDANPWVWVIEFKVVKP